MQDRINQACHADSMARLKITLILESGARIGPGKAALLESVRATGSIAAAARAMGMSEWQILTRVEMPLGLPLLIGGLRSATLQVVATATLAAYVGAGGLGRFLFLGLKTQDYPQMLAAALLVVVLALILEGVFEISERVTARRLHTH